MDYERARQRMIRYQIKGRGIRDLPLLAALGEVPREEFVAPAFRPAAYRDGPIPIGYGQTISQPYVVAMMTAALHLEAGDRILEVGTGSGYQAAVLAAMGAEVYTIERHGGLAQQARQTLERLDFEQVHLRIGDGSQGWPEAAPFEGILVTAAGPTIPTPLLEQLQVGARLIIPVEESKGRQILLAITRRGDGRYDRKELGEVAFVPLIGRDGWDDEQGTYWQ